MASEAALGEDEYGPELDFSSETFITRRDPLGELMHTFSNLYIDEEEEEEKENSLDDVQERFLPPPPLEWESEHDQATPITTTVIVEKLSDRLTEGSWEENKRRLSECVSQELLESKCQTLKKKMNYRFDRERDRMKEQLELAIRDLGKSMIDCLKRRDVQIEQKFKSFNARLHNSAQTIPNCSTPYTASQNQTYNVQNIPSIYQESHTSLQYNPPVKLEFPSFCDAQEEDPVNFIEQCEEYFAVRLLSDAEIMAALTAVLKGTAKDWWLAERQNVRNWKQFREVFLQSFLSEDYEHVAMRRLQERKQGVKECFRDFAYRSRALCMKWKSGMSERDIVQAVLRNCNPRLASLLRGTVKDVAELVRIGTQIERDFEESKRYWSQVNTADQKKKVQSARCLQVGPCHTSTTIVQTSHNSAITGVKTVTIPIILQDRYCTAMVDTGSTLSLIKKSTWEQIGKNESYQPCGGQAFLLANGQQQTPIGRVTWKCEIQGCKMELTLYIMSDADLTVPIILGMDFLMDSGLTSDFH
ncbi:uncharacterized protein LOC130085872 [Rhinichthys klamathensis goyatoka]|uniref:uncharacterized protein LOC130085872 n=1 Tax=Rhinichthys klamathensis goyatoka TaxID=3034132 RepID=UPI0024B59491|nr:uncharacterized protein LOC130085872 [Rhinichthys klamathensis goyatoka]